MYIVIEKHGGWEYAIIVTDENGNNKVFDTYEEAEIEAEDCQDGIIIPSEGFTKQQMLHTLVCMDQAINPKEYKTSKDLGREDFLDAAVSLAAELNLEEEFLAEVEKYKKYE